MFERELTQLATAIREAVTERREENSIATVRQIRVRRRDFTLRYRKSFEFANFQPERIEEDIWDWRDQVRFQDSVAKGLQEYRSLEAALGSDAHYVEGFAQSVAIASFHGLDESELSESVTALGREIEGRPLPVKVTAFIDGLSIGESAVVISDCFTLREPTPEDLAEYIVLDEYGGFSFPRGDAWFHVVGEFVFNAISTGKAQSELLRTIDALRLFRVGGITVSRYVMRSRHSFSHGGFLISSLPMRASQFAYSLASADATALGKFLLDVVPLLPDPLRPDRTMTEREIAYTRYSDALFQDRPSERAITLATTALEALFLEGESELTHRLSQRVSLFLRTLGTQLDVQRTYDNVKKGYKIRSTFIHGGSLQAKDRPQADSLAPILLEYARQCTLAFFQMTTRKGDLLRQIDRAMIDPAGAADLMAALEPIGHR